MSEERALLADTVHRLFGDAFARSGLHGEEPDASLWQQVAELGLPALLVPAERGGAGGGFEDALVVVRALGGFAIALPLAETLLAEQALAAAGLARPDGLLTIAVRSEGSLQRAAEGLRFEGTLAGVAWGADAAGIAVVLPSADGAQLALLRASDAAEVERGSNLAGEPRDRLRFRGAQVAVAPAGDVAAALLFDRAALLRVGQIAGALGDALERSIAHAQNRVQFGRPIGSFQAVQQQLARMASEVAAVDCAGAAAARAADHGDAGFEIACAKLRANQAIELGVAAAHQTHGAIGFTHECDLRLVTKRLLAWRGELGNDRFWAARLGAGVARRGAAAFWPDLTARADAIGVAVPAAR